MATCSSTASSCLRKKTKLNSTNPKTPAARKNSAFERFFIQALSRANPDFFMVFGKFQGQFNRNSHQPQITLSKERTTPRYLSKFPRKHRLLNCAALTPISLFPDVKKPRDEAIQEKRVKETACHKVPRGFSHSKNPPFSHQSKEYRLSKPKSDPRFSPLR